MTLTVAGAVVLVLIVAVGLLIAYGWLRDGAPPAHREAADGDGS